MDNNAADRQGTAAGAGTTLTPGPAARLLELAPLLVVVLPAILCGLLVTGARWASHVGSIRTGVHTYFLVKGDIALLSGDNAGAVEHYVSASRLNDRAPLAHLGLASAYARSQDYLSARASFDRVLEIDPDNAIAYNNLCWYGSLLGQVDQVMSACERAVQLGPNTPAFRDSRGLARALTGDYEGAIRDFTYFVKWVEANQPSRQEAADQRRQWIAALEAGQNPFDDETLLALLREE